MLISYPQRCLLHVESKRMQRRSNAGIFPMMAIKGKL
jgi:hypothetical protein